jgi:hypothetical protein
MVPGQIPISKKISQDYDIVYIVGEIAAFKKDPAWIDVFGSGLFYRCRMRWE